MANPRRHHWADDRGLELRMASTLLGLGAVYAGLLAALVLSGASALLVFAGGAVIAAIQLFTSDRLALRAVGAREPSPAEAAAIGAALDRGCMQMDMPRPRVAVVDSELANSLAVGRSRAGATVCVTTRALKLLEPGELEAVVAHELAHIQNRDVVVMTVAGFFSLVAALVLRFGWRIGHAGAKLAALLAALAAYALSFVLLRALARYRELAADRSAALATGRPSVLAAALVKLDADAARAPRDDLRKVEPVAAMCIVGPRTRQRLGRLTATHPSTERRLAALERLERRLQGTS